MVLLILHVLLLLMMLRGFEASSCCDELLLLTLAVCSPHSPMAVCASEEVKFESLSELGELWRCGDESLLLTYSRGTCMLAPPRLWRFARQMQKKSSSKVCLSPEHHGWAPT